MRIAILTDTHGNLHALQAALAAARQEGCEAIYHTGDVVGIGPYPAECVDLLTTVQAHYVLGNHEAYLLDLMPHDRASGMSADEVAHHAWVRDALGTSGRATVGAGPWLINKEIAGHRLAFMHYALDSSGRDFGPHVSEPTADTLDPLYAHHGADFVFYGHNHDPSDVRGRGRYINPGSLGCCHYPVARFVSLSVEDNGICEITKHAVPYDDTAFLQAFDDRAVPTRVLIRQSFLSR